MKIPLITECTKCHYRALTWHDSMDDLERCRKCDGLLRVIAKEKEAKK